MHFLSGVGHWFTTSSNWLGADGILERALEQLELSGAVVLVAGIIGVAIGFLLGRGRHGGFIAVNAANAARAIPSLSLITLLVIWPPISLKANGFDASFLALVALAIPPVLTNAFVAMREVDVDVIEAAKASGMTSFQRLIRVEMPLAAPLTVTGLRIAAIEVTATATLAAYISFNDLGVFIFAGLNTNDTVETFCGALTVAMLSFMSDLVLLGLYRLVTPTSLRRRGAALSGALGGTVRASRRAAASVAQA